MGKRYPQSIARMMIYVVVRRNINNFSGSPYLVEEGVRLTKTVGAAIKRGVDDYKKKREYVYPHLYVTH